jgi:TolB-like protein
VAEGGGDERASGSTPAVFISYASQDATVAAALVEALERRGIACWIAPRDVKPGAQYADAIVGAINAATAVVLVLSQNAVASSHVGREVERAASKHKPIIAFRIDAATLSRALEYFLSESQWIDISVIGMPAALAKLTETVKHGSGQAVAADPVASAKPHARTEKKAKLIAGAAVVITVGVAAALGLRFWSQSHKAAPPAAAVAITDKSIAVLPFVDMSEKKDQEYFADGMAEEVLDLLVKIPRLRVIGRTSSFQFKGRSEDLRTIGHTLGADYVVEGSVRKSGDRLRVTAQLISTQDGSHLWSETYDEVSGDVLKVQDQIAVALVRALQVSVGADDLQSSPPLKRTEAYDLYLRGRHAFDRFDQSGFEAAAGYFQQALDLDPSLARAADWLASTLENLAEWGYVQPIVGFERARSATWHALKLNSHSTLAHCQLAAISRIYDWDWVAAEREAEQARALGPSDAEALAQVAMVQSVLGRLDEGARHIRAAMTIDPFFAGWHEIYGNILFRQSRYAEAEAEFRKTLQISPTYGSGHHYLGQVLLFRGKFDEALAEMRQEADTGAGLASVYHAMGRKVESDAALARLTKERGRDVAFEIAQAHAYRGETDQAFEWLDRAYRQKDIELYWIKGDRLVTNLESDPRYKTFLRKMNLPE